jgi:uncharacterized protein (TIGR02996 family)
VDTEADWLSAIYQQPDDDRPRLLFADWLEEHGQLERAELIRLQCRRSGGLVYADEHDDRVDALLDKHRKAWSAHLPQQDKRVTWRFRRGLPEELEIPLEMLVDEWETWAAIPTVRGLYLYDCTIWRVHDLVSREWSPHWSVLRAMDHPFPMAHYQPYVPADCFQILHARQAGQLRELHFHYGVGYLAEHACRSPYLDGLVALGVDRRELADPRLVERFGSRLVEASYGDAG